jgi:quercetin dioxygenase-like cupin family protein
MQTLVTEPVVSDTITITEVRADPELMHAAAGAEVRWDQHDADHHIIVVSGTCRVLGRRIEAGASAFVPAGIAHTVQAGAWGCSFLSLDTASKEL